MDWHDWFYLRSMNSKRAEIIPCTILIISIVKNVYVFYMCDVNSISYVVYINLCAVTRLKNKRRITRNAFYINYIKMIIIYANHISFMHVHYISNLKYIKPFKKYFEDTACYPSLPMTNPVI